MSGSGASLGLTNQSVSSALAGGAYPAPCTHPLIMALQTCVTSLLHLDLEHP